MILLSIYLIGVFISYGFIHKVKLALYKTNGKPKVQAYLTAVFPSLIWFHWLPKKLVSYVGSIQPYHFLKEKGGR